MPAGGYDTRLAPDFVQAHRGNTNLGPETNIFRTFGFVYSPSFVPNLDINVDYWDTVFRDSISRPVAATMVTNCLTNPGDSRICPAGSIQRDASGAIQNIMSFAFNGPGGERYTGVDLNARYTMKTALLGTFGLEWNNTLLTKFVDVTTPPRQSRVGVYTPGGTRYRVRSNLNVDWNRAAWSVRWGMRYVSSLIETCADIATTTYATAVCNALGPVQSTNATTGISTYLPYGQGGSDLQPGIRTTAIEKNPRNREEARCARADSQTSKSSGSSNRLTPA